MSATPVAADHSEEFEQLAGLAALRALEGDELARFDQHAQQCERCRLIVRLDRETLRNLSLAAPEMDASPGLKDRLMSRAAVFDLERLLDMWATSKDVDRWARYCAGCIGAVKMKAARARRDGL